LSETDKKISAIVEAYFGEAAEAGLPESLERIELRGGEWLFRQGDPGDSLYFLVRGRLQALAEGKSEGGDGPRLLGEVLPGDSVGEAGLLSGAPRSAGIRAIRDSLLIRLDQAHFETLAARHPAMVTRLAGHLARLMQRNLVGTGSAQRPFSTLCLVRVHDTPRVREGVERLLGRLCGERQGLVVSPRRLAEAGAPVTPEALDKTLPQSLRNWLEDREDEYPLLVYVCNPQDEAWARFALRQSDLTLWMADGEEMPQRTPMERELRPAGKQALVLHHDSQARIAGTGKWLENRPVDFHLHHRVGYGADLERIVRVLSGQAIGLVLGSGAVRGLSELGVYKAMVELGIPVDWVGGSSIGSIVGAAIAMDRTPEQAISMARSSFVKGKPFSDYTLPLVSLVRGRRMVRLLRKHLDLAIEDLPIPFFCVSSRLDRGALHVHERGDIVHALRASAALPGVLPPVVVDQELVVDGAVLNHLPVDIMLHRPVARVVAIDVSYAGTRRVDYDETPGALPLLRSRLLPFGKRYRVPGLATLIMRSTEIGTQAQARERRAAADIVVNPPVRQFKMTDVKAFDSIVQVGYEEGLASLGPWWAGQQRTGD